jgi:acetyl-CoA carboxylase biotin carboxyl carrier protein
MALSDEDVREILRIIDESPLRELKVETDGFSLHVVRGDAPVAGGAAVDEDAAVEEDAPVTAYPPDESAPETDGLVAIESPMLGTFYRAEAPGQPPFVEVGSRVEADTTVCIIEVMKMMNSVPAGVAGTVAEIVAENAELVEYGAPLFRVRRQ